MENKKEPLMSAEKMLIKYHNNSENDWLFQNREVVSKLMKEYAKYVLNNAKEFVADNAVVCIPTHSHLHGSKLVDKQSIHTAIDNYIEINLNKEL